MGAYFGTHVFWNLVCGALQAFTWPEVRFPGASLFKQALKGCSQPQQTYWQPKETVLQDVTSAAGTRVPVNLFKHVLTLISQRVLQ
ncbi:MAG: hypothetical protein COB66_08595 [Coxiella sp. (in: Bacteria)]|nr:MAG: hypothetical protein COB66_08595 [Coxiella sp. (in: g-proteobacteria)]